MVASLARYYFFQHLQGDECMGKARFLPLACARAVPRERLHNFPKHQKVLDDSRRARDKFCSNIRQFVEYFHARKCDVHPRYNQPNHPNQNFQNHDPRFVFREDFGVLR